MNGGNTSGVVVDSGSWCQEGCLVKIAYVAYVDMKRSVGVAEKIRDQMASLAALGHEVCLFDLTPDVLWDGFRDGSSNCVTIPHESPHQLGILSGICHEISTVNQLAYHMGCFAPDVIYLRYPGYRPRMGRILRAIAPLVIEVNGNPLLELRAQGRSGMALLEAIMGGQLLRHASGIVGVTSESADYGICLAKGAVQSLVLGNGIDCERVRFLTHVPGENVNAAYVGDKTVYAGLDRVMKPLVNRDRKGLVLHVIGRGWVEDDYARQLSRQGKLVIHGYVTGRDLEAILQRMDICIGPLGVHRKGILETTSLKVRRYLAHGIPTVIGHKDPDLDRESDYILHIPADDSPVLPETLLEFGIRAGRSEHFRMAARMCAESRLGWKTKSVILASFFERVISCYA